MKISLPINIKMPTIKIFPCSAELSIKQNYNLGAKTGSTHFTNQSKQIAPNSPKKTINLKYIYI